MPLREERLDNLSRQVVDHPLQLPQHLDLNLRLHHRFSQHRQAPDPLPSLEVQQACPQDHPHPMPSRWGHQGQHNQLPINPVVIKYPPYTSVP